jgi:MFS family permease
MKQYSKIRLYLAIAAISFLQGLQFSVSPVLGKIQAHYPDVNVSLVQMLITAPGLFSLVVSLVSGWLVLKITKKKLLIFAGFVAGVTGLLPFLHDSFPLLLVSRTVYGISLGIATTMNMAVVADFFEGNERVKAMGIQAASVGAGMVVTTVCAGFLGRGDFRNSYFINLIGFVSMIVLITCLPETGVAKETKTEKIRLNGKVLIMDLFALLENVFLITYTTNIAMHLSGALAGNSSVSGTLTGIFSGVQILAGILLGLITAKLKKYTPAAAMLSFSAGAVLLTLFPGNYALLMVSSVLCGMSQGVFIPTASTYLSNHVAPVATALAAATMTTAMNAGQLLSPVLLNTAAAQVFGKTTTTGVYIISAIGMTISAGAMIAWQHFSKDE